MEKRKIESVAWDLQVQIWKDRWALWPDGPPEPIEMLDPEIAAKILEIHYERHEELPLISRRDSRTEVAGLVDRQARKIAVAQKFGLEVERFTGGHEVGHWMLHPGEVMHRDRPMQGVTIDRSLRNPVEREADYFSACFLVSENMLRDEFKRRFLTESHLEFDDSTAFWLCPQDPDSVFGQGPLERAVTVASARTFGGGVFDSLAKRFRVSTSTMAIRLLEIGIIGR